MNLEEFYRKYNYYEVSASMRQYLDIKYNHIDCLLLYRMGDFYELFYEDADRASKILGIALTTRNKNEKNTILMCGVPHHAVKSYILKLINEGMSIAICEQLETPEEAKNKRGYNAIVKRDVVRIITPGTILEEELIEASIPHYLATIHFSKDKSFIAYLDISTAQIFLLTVPMVNLVEELHKISPKEVLINEKLKFHNITSKLLENNIPMKFQQENLFELKRSKQIILDFYKIFSIQSIGNVNDGETVVLGVIIEYVILTQKHFVPKLLKPKILNYDNYVFMDHSSRTKLDLIKDNKDDRKNSLFFIINKTLSKPGSRVLYKYLLMPSTDINLINYRLEIVDFFYSNMSITEYIREDLKNFPDLEKAITKVSANRSNTRDLLDIANSIKVAENIKYKLMNEQNVTVSEKIEKLTSDYIKHYAIYKLISDSINPDLNSDYKIKKEYNPKLHELHDILEHGSDYIDKLQVQYRKETAIDNLKISYNNMLGFFIEVTTKNISKIQDGVFIHKQSTKNFARFSTDKLKDIENQIINAKLLLVNLEKKIYHDICSKILEHEQEIRKLTSSLSFLDVICSFAYLAYNNSYVRPILTKDRTINIISGRHPIVEQHLKFKNQDFISNNINLSESEQICLITGPNMSGKSTFLKQTAIIAILAHMGCFVPAEFAQIGIIDKIFTRIGAGDNLSKGESTFMVEMIESSSILNQSTDKSLVILDEVGRGTSTYDGVAIAWSILEYIHDILHSRCLFATHYHELIKLEKELDKLVNYTTDIYEEENKIVFLHRVKKGSSNKSYGIHVAKLAGLPTSVVKRANELLASLEHETKSC